MSRIDRVTRKAEREEIPDNPRAPDVRDGKPLIVMAATALAATALVLGMMWMNNARNDSAGARAVAQHGE